MKKLIFSLCILSFFALFSCSKTGTQETHEQPTYPRSGYGDLGSARAVVDVIEENYICPLFHVEKLTECIEVSEHVLEYKCYVCISGARPVSAHGTLYQDELGRNQRGSFEFDDNE